MFEQQEGRPAGKWDKLQEINARFHAQFQVDLHSFDQNILSLENSLF